MSSREWVSCRLAWICHHRRDRVAACTVHLWNNTFGFFMFMIGAGAWLVDRPQPKDRSRIDDDYDDITISKENRMTAPAND